MTKEQAYKILEIDQTASKEDIKRKYENLLRLAKFDEEYDAKALIEANDTLMGYSFGQIKNEQDIYKKGINKKKIENFLYYHKNHLIYGSIAIAIFIIFVILLFKKANINSIFGLMNNGFSGIGY